MVLCNREENAALVEKGKKGILICFQWMRELESAGEGGREGYFVPRGT
jgi:hypothetical protein